RLREEITESAEKAEPDFHGLSRFSLCAPCFSVIFAFQLLDFQTVSARARRAPGRAACATPVPAAARSRSPHVRRGFRHACAFPPRGRAVNPLRRGRVAPP